MSGVSAWLDNFVTHAGANLANLGIVQADIEPIVATQGNAGSLTRRR